MERFERPTVLDVGNARRLVGEFTNQRGVPTDPATVVCKYQDPAGMETTKTYGVDLDLVKQSTGIYYLDIDVNEAGTWYYRFEGTGDVKSAGERTIIARESVF